MRAPRPSRERAPMEQATTVFLLGCVAAIALEAALYLRLGPFGTPYAESWWPELGLAAFFECYGLALVSGPFFFLAWVAKQRVPGTPQRSMHVTHIAFVIISLIICHADNEIRRFMGIPLTVGFLKTYGRLGNTPAAIGHAVVDDPGGAYSAYLLLVIPLTFFFAAVLLSGRDMFRRLGRRERRAALIFGAFVFYIAPFFYWHVGTAGSPRLEKFRPPALMVVHEIRELFAEERSFARIDEAVREFRRTWKLGDPEDKWVFQSPDYPLSRVHRGPCPKRGDRPWNFVLLQLETFRAQDLKLFNPSLNSEPTPFLDRLGRSSDSAYWPRFYCNGLPTVYAFMALHTGLLPHSEKRAATAFVDTRFDSLPQILRGHGYHTAFFSGPDPDWDNERYWLNQWYDYVVYDPSDGEEDRPLFERAARYLKGRGDEKQPFFAVVASITNHIPFRSPEPELNIESEETIYGRLHNTMRYTDDVVREFFDAIDGEPWFDRTVFLIFADHAYDLGDRGWFIGHTNLRHESTWIPLIVHGKHPAVSEGRQVAVGSHIDIAPTIMELAGICDANSFMGHSLLGADETHTSAVSVRSGNLAFETPAFSIYYPRDEPPRVYDAEDYLQLRPLSDASTKQVAEHFKTAGALSEVSDFVHERDRVVAP